MPYDQAGQGWEVAPGYKILDISYTYDITQLPKVGADVFRVPSHVAKPDLSLIGALLPDAIGTGNEYQWGSGYYQNRTTFITTYDQDPQEGRQLVVPNDRAEAWIRDYNGNWRRLGWTQPVGDIYIFRFDILSEIYYEDQMNLPATTKNIVRVPWIRTDKGWFKPQDVLVVKEGGQGTWAKMAWGWVGKEIHFEAWIQE